MPQNNITEQIARLLDVAFPPLLDLSASYLPCNYRNSLFKKALGAALLSQGYHLEKVPILYFTLSVIRLNCPR
jgi:hypothetical protein